MRRIIVSFVVFASLAFAAATVGADDTDDIDIIMSDMPLVTLDPSKFIDPDNFVSLVLIDKEVITSRTPARDVRI